MSGLPMRRPSLLPSPSSSGASPRGRTPSYGTPSATGPISPPRSGLPTSAGSPSTPPASRLAAPDAAGRAGLTSPSKAGPGSELRRPAARSSLAPAAAGTPASALAPRTPRRSLAPRTSFAAASGSSSSAAAPPLPKPYEGSTLASAARGTSAAPELGDTAVFVSEGRRLTGVVRFLGAIAGKKGDFAGLELFGNSAGLGKNDGTVAGEQYFACEPLCGIFCKPHQLSVVAASSLDATARPQSAMSQRSGRTSALGSESGRTSATGFRRAATPESGMRPRSSMAMATPAGGRSNGVRPPSVTPHSRPSSSMSTHGRPSSVLSHSSSNSRPASRLGPRKSHADLALDEAGRRRAKTSAEAAAEAEARIHVGSRAARFINAKAADLVATRREAEPPASTAARPASPLKDSLLARGRTSMGTPSAAGAALRPPRTGGPPVTPLGGAAAPRIAKARTSGLPAPFAAPRVQVAEAMGPPASPSRTEGSEELRKSTGARPVSALSTHGASDSSPRTPGKGGESNGHEAEGTVRKTRQRSSVHALLEEMDLTPRRPGLLFSSSDGPDERLDNSSPSRAHSALSEHGSSVVEPVVPVSMLEEAQADIELLREQLATLSREAAAAKKTEAQERERARAAATEAVRRELDEEREVERADQLRRRRETEEREAAAREKLLVTHREAVERLNAEHARRVEELQSKLGEGEETLADLKRALGGEEKEKSAALVKDAEIARLKERLARVEASLANERETLQAEINDLTQSGQEMSSLYEDTMRLKEDEAEAKLRALSDRAQEAIAAVEAQRDEAVEAARVAASKAGPASGSAAAIDLQTANEQLAHEKQRYGTLEDQYQETLQALETERQTTQRRRDKFADAEQRLKEELRKARAEVASLTQEKMRANERLDELNDELAANRAALETERSELEALRAETHGIGAGPSMPEERSVTEKVRLESEVMRLTSLLEGARSAKRDALQRAEALVAEREELKQALAEQSSLDSSQDLRAHKSHRPKSSSRPSTSGSSPYVSSPTDGSFGTDTGATTPSHRSSRRISGTSTASRRTRTSTSGGGLAQDETTGLRIIVGSLTEETSALKMQLREAAAELDAARQDLKTAQEQRDELQATVDSLSADVGGGSDTGAALVEARKALVEQTSALERRVAAAEQATAENVRRLDEAKRAHQKEEQSLQREIADLEALCESSVYRRDEQEALREELERKVSSLQRKLDRATAAAVPPLPAEHESKPDVPSTAAEDVFGSSSPSKAAAPVPAPAADAAPTAPPAATDDRPFCDDCEEYGHRLEDCTMNDVF